MARRIVFIVDDDPTLRSGLRRLLREEGYEVEVYDDGTSLLMRRPPDKPACVLLDLVTPGVSGLELQRRLRFWEPPPPIILMSAQARVPDLIEGLRQGAADVLLKPFHTRELLGAVDQALARAGRVWKELRWEDEMRLRLARLTPREREVFALVTEGMLNKQVAARLGTTEKTIKVHRSRVMHKLGAGSLAELVRLADRVLQVEGPDRRRWPRPPLPLLRAGGGHSHR